MKSWLLVKVKVTSAGYDVADIFLDREKNGHSARAPCAPTSAARSARKGQRSLWVLIIVTDEHLLSPYYVWGAVVDAGEY